jgi:tetratricopeptide (TPR) repeat protein
VLWFYFSLILVPDTRRLSLFHDDIGISRSLIDPWTTLPAVLGLLVITTFALLRARRHPAFSLAVLWFLAGHLLESTAIGLEIAHEHRNYLPSLGPILGITLGLASCANNRQRLAVAAIPVALLATTGIVAHARAHIWSDEEKIIRHMVANHPASPLAHAMNAQLLLVRNGDVAGALGEYCKAADLAPHEASYLILAAITAAESRMVSAAAMPSVSGAYATPETGQGIVLDESTLAGIGQRLATSPIGSTTEATLKRLHDCVLLEPQCCQSLCANAEAWYLLVLDSRRTSPRIHSNAAFYLASLYMHQNRFKAALQIAEEWAKRNPSNINYRLIAADAHLHLGHLDEAEQAILSVKSLPESGNYREATDHLLDALNKRRNRRNQANTY